MIPTLVQYNSLARAMQVHTKVEDPVGAAARMIEYIRKFSKDVHYIVLFVKLGTGALENRPWTLKLVGPGQEFANLADVERSYSRVGSDSYVPVCFVEVRDPKMMY